MFNNINMNFLNPHFFILIGIIIVIYFLYKEINFLNKKINKLEKIIESKNINHIPTPEITNKDDGNIIEYSSDNDFDQSDESSSSDHIAIYSNDNEHSNTISDNKKEITINEVVINKNEVTIIKDEVVSTNDVIMSTNDVIMSTNDVIMSTNDVIMSTNDVIINKDEGVSSNEGVSTNEVVINKDEVESTNNNKVNLVSNINKNDLEKMKLNEIKKIAEKYDITFSKKTNGVQKHKTKQELIDNILNKL